MWNLRSIERSTCVKPKPGMSFLPSVPCLGGEGIKNALGFRLLPPPAAGLEIHKGCPDTRSGRDREFRVGSGDANRISALNGNPLRATRTDCRDQWSVSRARGPDFAAAGIS